ncbi:FAD-dependent oxidoreductase [Erysipelothrix sp. HDW6C]|uniref:FAD-dependent oxidoreductase n=1 Tax=Erysipelothrix sp. HDW6C TaxID=2714930 RepID=UPI0014097A1C|nr:FAD-dependent oxidoreductase [Erysipelothrix sp. HDW6C]QIK70610.1 FAD-dependent oxidoreductase [Erysipelothrix sp. HDW6C]
MSTDLIYDAVILGGGPAGLSAGIYAARSGQHVLIIEKDRWGGQVTTTTDIVNYPGMRHTQGEALMTEMRLQAEDFGVEFKSATVSDVSLDTGVKVIETDRGVIKGYAVMIATGASPRTIGFPGELDYRGKGIAYCSTCDGEFFTGRDIFVIGGGFAAAEEAVFLTRFARKVHMIIREPDFTAAKATADSVKAHKDIAITYNTEVKLVNGEGMLTHAEFVNNQTGKETSFDAEEGFGMFVFAGTKPASDIFSGKVKIEKDGYIPTNEAMETNIAGVYAIGDIRVKHLRQIVTAVSDGAIAATEAEKYITEYKQKHNIVSQPRVVKERVNDAPKLEKTGMWFSETIRNQLSGIFSRLHETVHLDLFLDQSEKSSEMLSFVDEFVSLSDHLERGEVTYNQTDFVPRIQLQGTGISYAGIPSGHELNSLVLGIYNIGGPGQEITESQRVRIQALPEVSLDIAVSLTCHFCPDVVASCQRIASINPKVSAQMVDTGIFQTWMKSKKIMSVPAILIDNKNIVFGSKTMDEILDAIEKEKSI